MHEFKYLRRTFELAAEARERGDHPFGAVLVRDDLVVLEAQNSVVTQGDVTRHAELNLIQAAFMKWDKAFLRDCTLYSSTEPCAMCAGAIHWAGIPRVVFGLSASSLREIAGEDAPLVLRSGPLLEEEARDVHQGFWGGHR